MLELRRLIRQTVDAYLKMRLTDKQTLESKIAAIKRIQEESKKAAERIQQERLQGS